MENDKCKSLENVAKWGKWQTITKIDAIGSQMHVTYSLNPETQKRKRGGSGQHAQYPQGFR